jgi:hypothetical protein
VHSYSLQSKISSNVANGFAWLSNFWPFVDNKPKQSVDERTRKSKSSFEIDGLIELSLKFH